ncbi:MAG: UbiD family decarboxylase [Gemmatales bacterium]|nr:UbiD family decarboxylase [Gemmatales bacterium]MDW8387398.1 UbiD family decarboxylase [Gemmatales bacterium]
MGYRSLRECIADLERTGQLIRIEQEVDPYLEAAEIHRRVHQARGPAIYYSRVKGCRFPMVSNLFGTLERTRFLFRDTLESLQRLVRLRIDPEEALKKPFRLLRTLPLVWAMWPKFVRSGPVLASRAVIDDLPKLVSWPRDGGPFVTLPQVYTEDADRPGWQHSNLGMYRIQLSGNQYRLNEEIGLHYQIHRGIGVHHAAAIRKGIPFRVSIFVGGPPAMTLAAVMPLPEGMSELGFAGALGGRRVRLIRRVVDPQRDLAEVLAADADFVITGVVDPDRLLPEGPFGDHLGYYSLVHPFPVLKVEHVYHRPDAVWPFTVVGRPPQEDTSFGQIIHEITGPVIPSVVKGIHAVHAVDAAGVHPLLLAIGSERYVPYNPRCKPQELLTCANALLGQGQLSLAKYLLIVAREDDPHLDIHDIPAFFRHLLLRVDWTNDVHFQTRTTMDTLDYSGTGLNEGSKVVIAAVGPIRRQLGTSVPPSLRLPEGFGSPAICLPGILALQGPRHDPVRRASEFTRLCEALAHSDLEQFPLVVVVDDSRFVAESLNNFLWVTFTRSNPAADIEGVGSFVQDKHWGCTGPLIIDARIKPHHAPVVEPDPEVARRVEALAAPGGPLHGIL